MIIVAHENKLSQINKWKTFHWSNKHRGKAQSACLEQPGVIVLSLTAGDKWLSIHKSENVTAKFKNIESQTHYVPKGFLETLIPPTSTWSAEFALCNHAHMKDQI